MWVWCFGTVGPDLLTAGLRLSLPRCVFHHFVLSLTWTWPDFKPISTYMRACHEFDLIAFFVPLLMITGVVLAQKKQMIDREPSVALHAYLCYFEPFPSQLAPHVADWGSAVTDSRCSCFQLTDGRGDRLWCSLKTDSPCLCVLPQPFYSAVSHRQHG